MQRIAVARRAGELLEHKQQVLRAERRRLDELVERTGREWADRAIDAERWQVRAVVPVGRDELRRAIATVDPVDVRIEWRSQAGVEFPGTAGIAAAPAAPPDTPPVMARAAQATRRALDAAVQHAAATTARDRIDTELTATVRRLRAVRDRWLPDLERQAIDLELRLDEVEREEATRLRWATGHAALGSEAPR